LDAQSQAAAKLLIRIVLSALCWIQGNPIRPWCGQDSSL